MTKEQKLTKLLQIAVENGWKNPIESDNIRRIEIFPNTLILETFWKYDSLVLEHSLNDLVLNWEEGQISFIKALIKTSNIEDLSSTSPQFYQTIWVQKPTSQRLEYLFTTFKHLL